MPRRSSTTPARWPRRSSAKGLNVVTGGTDNHLMVVDVASTHGITGRQAEEAVRQQDHPQPQPVPIRRQRGLVHQRFAVRHYPAVTTLGMGKAEMDEIASIVALLLKNVKPGTTKSGAPRQG